MSALTSLSDSGCALIRAVYGPTVAVTATVGALFAADWAHRPATAAAAWARPVQIPPAIPLTWVIAPPGVDTVTSQRMDLPSSIATARMGVGLAESLSPTSDRFGSTQWFHSPEEVRSELAHIVVVRSWGSSPDWSRAGGLGASVWLPARGRPDGALSNSDTIRNLCELAGCGYKHPPGDGCVFLAHGRQHSAAG